MNTVTLMATILKIMHGWFEYGSMSDFGLEI